MRVKHPQKAGEQGFDVHCFQVFCSLFTSEAHLCFILSFSIMRGLIASEEATLYGLYLVRMSIRKCVRIVLPPPVIQ